LERLARAIFKVWFVDFEPVKAKAAGATSFPSMPQDVFASLPSTLADSELGPIPVGWEVKAVSEAFEVNPPRLLRKGEIAPYLDMKNMPTQGHAPESWIDRPFGSGMRFANGDTLVARITPCLENGKTAFVDFLAKEQVAWGSTEYIVLRPKEPLPPVFAYCLARTNEFRDYAVQNMSGTSGRQRVVSTAMDHFHIAVPAADIAVSFGKVVGPMFDCISASMNESRKLAEMRDYLLPKLLSGQVRVNEAHRLAKEAV
jgi:type I restriction enzyme S subunit